MAALPLIALALAGAWPAPAQADLDRAVAAARPGDYAVFDADGTLWSSDIEEAGIAFFEQRGWLSIATLDPALRPIPVLPGETLYGYYRRLCDFDAKLCLPWSAQVFAGQPLGVLKQRFDALLAHRGPIPVRYVRDGKTVTETIEAPRVYAAQRALIGALQAKGVAVYVVSASQEEVVRMVASDPRYGLSIPPERVIGTSMLLSGSDGTPSTARRDIAAGTAMRPGYWANRARLVPSTTLWSPLPWQEGKVAAIQAYIDPVRRPMLVAGDSGSDWPMLFHSGGVRLWMDHDAPTTARLRAAATARGGDAARRWVVVDRRTLAPVE
ncbi:HAD family hydrolase [Sphingomonas hankookensis]|uniref:HAD family hydrolase n=1 Tax=Sphingomonas hankookensis TaxID=563996 RepID=UPI001F565268|nr:HAD family hydrolase [Sphingomonas hankookensis]